MNKAHLVVSQNFVFQNRASRSCKAHLHVSQNFVFRIVHAPCRWSLTGLFAMQTKNAGADEKTKLLPTSSRVMPIKGSCKLPPQWAEGMPVLLAYLDRHPCPINLLRRRCANWTIPSGRGVFHSTGHATGEPCAARTWQPMTKRLPFRTDVFPAGVKPLPP